jgi:hypothetical protein
MDTEFGQPMKDLVNEQALRMQRPDVEQSGAGMRALRESRQHPTGVTQAPEDDLKTDAFQSVQNPAPKLYAPEPEQQAGGGMWDRIKGMGQQAMGGMKNFWHNLTPEQHKMLLYGGGGIAGLMALMALLRSRRREKYASVLMSPNDRAYADAFIAKCAAANIDPEQTVLQMIKRSAPTSEAIAAWDSMVGGAEKAPGMLKRVGGAIKAHPWRTGASAGVGAAGAGIGIGAHAMRTPAAESFSDKIKHYLAIAGRTVAQHPYITGGALAGGAGVGALISALHNRAPDESKNRTGAADAMVSM